MLGTKFYTRQTMACPRRIELTTLQSRIRYFAAMPTRLGSSRRASNTKFNDITDTVRHVEATSTGDA